MPELPDLTVYAEALERYLRGRAIERVRLKSPFLVRTADPPISVVEGKRVRGVRRQEKRIVVALEEELFLVFHLMIAGRFRWRDAGARIPGRIGLAALDFEHGTLVLTEASTRKRASLHVVRGAAAVEALRRGGVEPLSSGRATFAAALRREDHTLKRALTDPELFSGIGNAYSDEILHRAKLAPTKRTRALDGAEIARLHRATREVLAEWTDRLRTQAGDGFPEQVTAFRPEMAVHGRYGKPCPVCGTPVQRIVYAENEANYCPRCQTDGRILADRALSRLLRGDWPKTLEDLEERRAGTARAR